MIFTPTFIHQFPLVFENALKVLYYLIKIDSSKTIIEEDKIIMFFKMLQVIIFKKEDNEEMKDTAEGHFDEFEGISSVLKVIFLGLSDISDLMPNEIAYTFLPKLREQILGEKDQVYYNLKI